MKEYCETDSVQLIFSGEDYFSRLDMLIADAKEVIHLHMYILDEDETGLRVLNSLEKAVQRGVKVFVLLDAYGSKSLSSKFINDIADKGIRVRKFSPFFSSESIFMGRRLHHKIAVADKRIALTGGINVADKYRGTAGEAAWLDYAVLIKGEVCEYLHLLCERIFNKRNYKRLKEYACPHGKANGVKIRFRRNDWVLGKNDIHRSYVQAITGAKHSVKMVSSYFMPGDRLKKELRKASKRGVKVEIILAGKSDLPFLMHAEKWLYDYLARHGVVLYEWNDSILHGKAICVDGKWVSIGSYNLNYVSRYRSIELNADVLDPGFASSFEKHFDELKENKCTRITKNSMKHGLFYRFENWLAYNYYRGMMRLLLPNRKK